MGVPCLGTQTTQCYSLSVQLVVKALMAKFFCKICTMCIKTLRSIRVDVTGATRFGVNDGQLTKRTNVAKFVSFHAIDVKV